MNRVLRKVFSIVNDDIHKVITVFGIKIKFKSGKLIVRNLINQMQNGPVANLQHIEELKSCIIASNMHIHLKKYRGYYKGKDIVIIGCGPTLEYFEPIQDAIYIGINRAFKCEKVKFDYLFASDNFPEGMNEFIDYNANMCNKFITYWQGGDYERIRQNDLEKMKNFQYVLWGRNNRMPMDISIEPFGAYNYFSTSSIAMQFALYTLPKRIYLVGMDCTIDNIYRSTPTKFFDGTYHSNVDGWRILKEDINDKYPNIQVVSVNPAGLKGMFHDVYTKSFINEHSELLNENIMILSDEVQV